MNCFECLKIIPILFFRWLVWMTPYCFKPANPPNHSPEIQLQLTHSRNGGWYSGYYRHTIDVRDTFYVLLGLKLRMRGFKELITFVERLAFDMNAEGQVPCRYDYSWYGVSWHGTETPAFKSKRTKTSKIDANIYFLIMIGWLYDSKPKLVKRLYLHCQRAYKWLETFQCQNIIYEPEDASWENTLKHPGHLLMTNVIYIQAIRSMELLAMVNRDNVLMQECVSKHTDYIRKWQPELYRTQEVIPRILAIYWNMVPSTFLMSFNQELSPPWVPLRTHGPITVSKTFHSWIRGMSDLHDTVAWPFVGFLWMAVLATKMKKDIAKGWWDSYNEFHRQKTIYDIYCMKTGKIINRAFIKSTPTHAVTLSMYIAAKELIHKHPV